jgi:hypothetical protein
MHLWHYVNFDERLAHLVGLLEFHLVVDRLKANGAVHAMPVG